MITDRLKNLLRILIFAFLASGIALVLLLQIQNYHRIQIYLATEAAMPRHKPNGELRQYKNETAGYSFMYPSKLSISTSAGAVELYHQIPYKNSGECNMKGDEVVYDYLADFRVNIFITEGTIAQAVKKISPYMPEENYAGDALKISPGFIDSFEVGGLKGFSIYEGVEGCGHIIYYFSLADAKVLVIKRNLVEKLSSAVTPEVNQDVLVTPGVINPGQADLIFNQILKSFRYYSQVFNSRELDTNTWKTYKNEEFGFEFKYPESASLNINTDQKKLQCGDAFKPLGCIWVKLALPSTSYIEYFRAPIYDIVGGTNYKLTASNKEYDAVTVDWGGYPKTYVFLGNDMVISFLNEEGLSDQVIFNEFLSTFKFTK